MTDGRRYKILLTLSELIQGYLVQTIFPLPCEPVKLSQ